MDIEGVWETFCEQPRHQEYNNRHLVIPRQVILTFPVLEYLIDRLSALPLSDRPTTLAIDAKVDGDWTLAEHIVKLVQLCASRLQCLKLNGSETFGIAVLQMVPAEMLANLDSIFINASSCITADCNLIRALSSSNCRIRSFAVFESDIEGHTFITNALRDYAGLRKLHIGGAVWNGEDGQMQRFLSPISATPSLLTHLHLHELQLKPEDLPFLVRMLQAQPKLQVFDLTWSYLFYDEDVEDATFEDANGPNATRFLEALATHPTLEQLILVDIKLNNDIFGALLSALHRKKSKISKLDMRASAKLLNLREGGWAALLPQLVHLRSLYGLEPVFHEDLNFWETAVLPSLRQQNTTLEALSYSGDDFLCRNKTIPTALTWLSVQTRHFLCRNKLLHLLDQANATSDGVPLPLWSKLLERFAAKQAGACATFGFLRSRVSQFVGNSCLVSSQVSRRFRGHGR